MNNVTIKKAGLIIIFLGLAGALAITFLPTSMQSESITFIPIPAKDDSLMPVDLPAYLNQEHLLTFTYPKFIWLGDSQYVMLKIQPGVSSQVEQIDPTSDYFTSLEVRLELLSMQTSPGNAMYQVFQSGKPAQFLWQVTAENRDETVGKLWLYITVYQNKKGLEWTIPLFVLPIEISVRSWMGWTLPIMRGLIIVGLVCLITLWIILITPKIKK